jgi:hypothetical protein
MTVPFFVVGDTIDGRVAECFSYQQARSFKCTKRGRMFDVAGECLVQWQNLLMAMRVRSTIQINSVMALEFFSMICNISKMTQTIFYKKMD